LGLESWRVGVFAEPIGIVGSRPLGKAGAGLGLDSGLLAASGFPLIFSRPRLTQNA
jgi:hypothetical protein